jgi:hypothetical protein
VATLLEQLSGHLGRGETPRLRWVSASVGETIKLFGIDEILFVSGDNVDPDEVNGGWKVLRDPATPPGQTAGRIIRLGMEEAAARGVEVPTLNFSDTVDSNGDAWDATIPLAYRVPATEWDILESLTPWVEFSMDDVGYTLNVVNLSTGLGSATTVELDPVTFTKLAGAG